MLAPLLARHGLTLRRSVLTDPQRSFREALERQRRANRRVARDLSRTLDRLETLVAGCRGRMVR
jgi:hypothetical protein